MSGKPVRCRLGWHNYVKQPPADERSHGPNDQVCRLCGKRRSLDPMWSFGAGG